MGYIPNAVEEWIFCLEEIKQDKWKHGSTKLQSY